ncbi:prepilin peptidase [Aciduricibacillus chroicocephali]|uniref:Prepilin peptidase n=1 Tax=Aciduricibacillus chroicocephali TaxID=3054939 RepID=A0ABY9KTR7_9BACI|nr:prepilin peptidase [Bacillaceae bacterium 44XB]
MEPLLYTYLFIFGLIFGSFYNVVGIRLAHGKSIVHPRSHCPKCGHTLTAFELIPVFSWIIQRGRCRNCKTSVSPKYAIFELLTASLFTISPILTGWSKDLVVALVLISFVIILAIADLDSGTIPRQVLLFFLGTGVLLRIFIPMETWWNPWLGALAGYIIFTLINRLQQGSRKNEYALLAAVNGLFIGIPGIVLVMVIWLFNQIKGSSGERHRTLPITTILSFLTLLMFFVMK